MKRQYILLVLFSTLLSTINISAQSRALKDSINTYLQSVPTENMNIGNYYVRKIWLSGNTLNVRTTAMFGGFPFRPESVDSITAAVRSIANAELPGCSVEIYVDRTNIKDLVPHFYATNKSSDRQFQNQTFRTDNVVTRLSDSVYTQGLTGRNLALWHSHGKYYKQQEDRWVWQRARLFTTVEDKFSPSFVIPYLLPMLENAGANVFLPRERDPQPLEEIVDNDDSTYQSTYEEYSTHEYVQTKTVNKRGKQSSYTVPVIQTDTLGFADTKHIYTEWDNPFRLGTYKKLAAQDTANAWIHYTPYIRKDGDYSVWVSYKTLPNSVSDAHYTVHHSDGATQFRVNQTMGGGTWIYLGTFHFKEGSNAWIGRVELSNESAQSGIVTADAVRFGGGEGNIGRRPADASHLAKYKKKYPERRKTKLIGKYSKEDYTTSGVARFWEGSRYWMQWAGVPDSVYSVMMGLNDYTDDYGGRGPWVNWLNQGSRYAPDTEGLGIPIDASLAFHTDAGVHLDTVIGTLGIYSSVLSSESKTKKFPTDVSRLSSRDMADMVMTTVCNDISSTVNPRWTRRGMWDRSYSESRRPEVPSMILELLSHQNVEDMRLGLDPRFKFLVTRAVYKGLLRYIYDAYALGSPVVQPLPVEGFAAEMTLGEDSVRLRWQPRVDKLEISAVPSSYIVFTSKNGGWDNGIHVTDTCVSLPIDKDIIYSYKIVAANAGGRSMDSETLSVCSRTDSKGMVMVVNGFTRVGAPEVFRGDSLTLGFSSTMCDGGVANGVDLQYTGEQYDFNIQNPWVTDDAPGWGASHSKYETQRIVGNTFNYPLVHGRAIVKVGYSFCSSSLKAVEDSVVCLRPYAVVDLILGKQKHTPSVDSVYGVDYTPIPSRLQTVLRQYTSKGGALLVTGAYLASGMQTSRADKAFIKEVLGVSLSTSNGSTDFRLKTTYAPNCNIQQTMLRYSRPNQDIYDVSTPEALLSASSSAHIFLRYYDNEKGAGVIFQAPMHKAITIAVPFETIMLQHDRVRFMKQILQHLTNL